MSGKGAAEEGSNEAQGKKRARSAEIGTDGEFTGIPIKNRIIDEARSLSERVRRWGENAYFGGPDMRKTDEFRKGIWPANFDNHDDAMRYGESMRKNSETPTAEEEEEARAGSRSRNSSPFRHQTPGQYQPVRQGSGYTTSGGSTRRGRKSKSRRSKSKRSKRSKKSKKSKRTRRGKTRR